MKKNYMIPVLKTYKTSDQDTVFDDCLLLVGTTIPVDPKEEGSQSNAESKKGTFEDTDNALRSFEHDPLDYLPDAFQDIWREE